MTNQPSKALSRRDALKLLGAAAGASVLANLPSKWSTPQLAAGVLPAHAQTSAVGCPDLGMIVTLSWEGADLDLRMAVPVPGGFLVTPKPSGGSQGLTEPFTGTQHSGDSTDGVGGETITVPMGNLINGVWTISFVNLSDASVVFNFTITGACSFSTNGLILPGEPAQVSIPVVGCVVSCPSQT